MVALRGVGQVVGRHADDLHHLAGGEADPERAGAGQHQRRGAGHVRRGRGGAVPGEAVAAAPVGRRHLGGRDDVEVRAVVRVRGVDREVARHLGEVGVAGGEVRGVGVDPPDRQHVVHHLGVVVVEVELVARGHRHHHAVTVRVADRPPQRRAEGVRPQAHADHARPVVGRVDDSLGHPHALVQDVVRGPQRHDPRGGGDARYADAVVRGGSEHAGHVGAVRVGGVRRGV